jgi:microsomal dipeptidase-like Zn-dependent dipeptidase
VWPAGIEWLHQRRSISPALQARGFSPGEAAGVMGLNFLRVLDAIWGS